MNLRFLLLVSLITSLLSSLQSQVLVKENNLWSNLIEESLPGTYSFHLQKIQGDTMFDNKSYKKLIGTTNILQTNWNYEAALRETEPGKVYIIKAGSYGEHLLYDFNITVNDTFTGFFNECEYKLLVDSIVDKILMNGEIRKQYFFTGIAGFFGYENWIQEIGSDNGLTYSGVYLCTTDIYPSLNCFTENAIVKVYNNADYPCFSSTGLVENPSPFSSLISPNPVNDIATIHLKESHYSQLNLLVLDSLGREVALFHSENGNQIILNREGLPAGIYIYILYSGIEQISNGKFIIR